MSRRDTGAEISAIAPSEAIGETDVIGGELPRGPFLTACVVARRLSLTRKDLPIWDHRPDVAFAQRAETSAVSSAILAEMKGLHRVAVDQASHGFGFKRPLHPKLVEGVNIYFAMLCDGGVTEESIENLSRPLGEWYEPMHVLGMKTILCATRPFRPCDHRVGLRRLEDVEKRERFRWLLERERAFGELAYQVKRFYGGTPMLLITVPPGSGEHPSGHDASLFCVGSEVLFGRSPMCERVLRRCNEREGVPGRSPRQQGVQIRPVHVSFLPRVGERVPLQVQWWPHQTSSCPQVRTVCDETVVLQSEHHSGTSAGNLLRRGHTEC